MKPVAGIYRIVHLPTEREYIGSAVRLGRRFSQHRSALNAGEHCNPHLQHAWTKYAAEQFLFQIIELVADVEKLIEREQFHIDARRPAFNMCRVAGSPLGIKRSEETKNKLRISSTGRKASLATRKLLRAIRVGAPRNQSPAFRKAMSELVRNRNPAWRAKLSASAKGRPISESQKRKMSKIMMGHAVSTETRAKISAKLKGVPWTAKKREVIVAAKRIKKTRAAWDRWLNAVAMQSHACVCAWR